MTDATTRDATVAVPGKARRARSTQEEADHLLALYGSDSAKILDIVHDQLTNLTSRAQTLLQLAGLTITVTGFSGTSIARTGPLAAWLVVSGLVVVLVAASLSMGGILRIRWMTQLAPTSLPPSGLGISTLRTACGLYRPSLICCLTAGQCARAWAGTFHCT